MVLGALQASIILKGLHHDSLQNKPEKTLTELVSWLIIHVWWHKFLHNNCSLLSNLGKAVHAAQFLVLQSVNNSFHLTGLRLYLIAARMARLDWPAMWNLASHFSLLLLNTCFIPAVKQPLHARMKEVLWADGLGLVGFNQSILYRFSVSSTTATFVVLTVRV